MGQKRSAEAYESDGGFVEDAPKSKKNKGQTVKSSAKVLEKQKDDDNNTYWEISKARRVTLSEFKGKTMVSIREYYEKDGKTLPGKKGISLTTEQFDAVIDLLPQLEAELSKAGHRPPRPAYDGAADIGESSEDEPEHSRSSKAGKGNHEATSDEDSD